MPETMDIYLVQHPDTVPDKDPRGDDYASPKDFLRNMLKAYKEGIPVKDISDFIERVMVEFFSKGKLVKKMVIGAHGAGLPNGYGNFHIGREFIQDDEEGQQKLERTPGSRPGVRPPCGRLHHGLQDR